MFVVAAHDHVTLDVGVHPALPVAVVLEAEALSLSRALVTLRCCHLVVVRRLVPLHRLVQLTPAAGDGGLNTARIHVPPG